jgi:hypothetical protein
VRVIAPGQPLFGREVWARHVYRRYGRLWLVVVPGDGGVTSVAVQDTDVLEAESVVAVVAGTATLSSEGARRLIGLLGAALERIAADAGGRAALGASLLADGLLEREAGR